MKQFYQHTKFTGASLRMIACIEEIIDDFRSQGFVLTVRQLYYQLVAKDIIPNTLRSYKNTASLLNDARIAGLIDWDAIEDRTRAFVRRARWDTGREILESAAASFHMDMWYNQESRPFVIIEKEALVGVLSGICRRYDVPLLAARGYPSASVLREFAKDDIIPFASAGQSINILHLGDHDPSGIDMTRDLMDRLTMFAEVEYLNLRVEVDRIALNMEQIEERKPPPNPAKMTDARFESYAARFGDESWELDALPPQYLVELVERQVMRLIDQDLWDERRAYIDGVRGKLQKIAAGFKQ